MDKIDKVIEDLKTGIEAEQCIVYATEGCVCCKRWITLIEKVIKSLEAAKAEQQSQIDQWRRKADKGKSASFMSLSVQERRRLLSKQARESAADYEYDSNWVEMREGAEQPATQTAGEPEVGEFIEKAKALRRKGATKEQWIFATMLGEACDRLDAQQRENERLNESCGFLRNEMDYLATENKAQAERIAELEKTIGRVSQLMSSDIIPTYDDLEQALQLKEGEKP